MSTIIRSQDDLSRLGDFYSYLVGKDFDHDAVAETMSELIASSPVKPELYYHDGYLAQFIPKYNSIVYNPYDMDRVLDMLYLALHSQAGSYLELRAALLMYIIGHEIEHYHQYLVSEGIEHLDSTNMEKAYKLIYGLDKQRTILERINHKKHLDSLVKYNQGNANYFVERNAQVESYDMIVQVLKAKKPALAEEFNKLRNLYLAWGYADSPKGNVQTTMDEIGLTKQYHYKEEDLSYETRIRYGLPISLEEQERVLKLK